MGAANRVAVNTGILYARMAITVFISLYATRLVLAALGAEDYGIFNVVGGAIVMLTFLNNAMASATQRFMSYAHGEGDESKQKKIFNASVVLHFLIGIILVLILESAGYFLFKGVFKIDPERLNVAKLIYHFLIVSTFVTVISVPYGAVINAHENMLFVAILGVLEALLKLGIAFYITHTSVDKLGSYGFLMAALAVLLLLIQRVYCHRKYEEVEINIKKYYDKTLFKEMTGFAGWSFLGSAGSMIGNYGKGIVLNMFFGTIVNAAQGIANQISGQLGAFATTMLKALNPIIAKSEGAGNRLLMIQASMMGSKVSFLLLTLFFVPVIVEMPYILKIWLKDVPEYTIIFCRLYLVQNLLSQMFVTLSSMIAAQGNIKNYNTYISILYILPLGICILLFHLGYPPFFLYLVFIANEILVSCIRLYFANKNCDLSISTYLKNVVLRCTSLFIIDFALSAAPIFIIQEGIIRLIIVCVVSLISFILLAWFLGFSRVEKINLLNVVKNINIKRFYKVRLGS